MDMRPLDDVFRSQRPFVERALRRFGVPERDLPDATQDVFVVVHRKLPTFEGRSSVTTWLYRIAFHVASQHRRRAYNRHEVIGDHEVFSDTEMLLSMGVDHERRELVENAIASLDELDPDRRDVFVDFDLHDEPMERIARRLGLPLKTAFSRLYAARRDLMRRMRESGLAAVFLPGAPSKHSAWTFSVATAVTAGWLLLSLHAMPTPLLLTHTLSAAPLTRAPMFERVPSATPSAPLPALSTAPVRARRHAKSAQPAERYLPATVTTETLVVFRDSEADLAPSLPPPLLAELPPAAAREPRIQLRGQRAPRIELTRVE